MNGIPALKILSDVVAASHPTGELKEQELEKVCPKCKEKKLLSEFHDLKRHSKKEKQSWCKKCAKERSKLHYHRNALSYKENNEIKEKICSKCKETKKIDEFSINFMNKDRKSSKCKKCVQTYARTRIRNGGRVLDARDLALNENAKICLQCNIKKDLSEFYKNKNHSTGVQPYCIVCIKQNNNTIDHKDKIKKYSIIYNKEKHDHIIAQKRAYGNLPAKFSMFSDKISIAEYVNEDINGNLICKCTYCGKKFNPTFWEVSRRHQALNGKIRGEQRLYCSEECKKACPIFKKIKYSGESKKASSREVSAEFRQMALQYYNYICSKCNSTENGLHVHHIDGVVQSPLTQMDLINVIVVCKKCHWQIHSIPGCNNHDYQCNP